VSITGVDIDLQGTTKDRTFNPLNLAHNV